MVCSGDQRLPPSSAAERGRATPSAASSSPRCRLAVSERRESGCGQLALSPRPRRLDGGLRPGTCSSGGCGGASRSRFSGCGRDSCKPLSVGVWPRSLPSCWLMAGTPNSARVPPAILAMCLSPWLSPHRERAIPFCRIGRGKSPPSSLPLSVLAPTTPPPGWGPTQHNGLKKPLPVTLACNAAEAWDTPARHALLASP